MTINTSPNRLRELALSIKAQHQQMGVDVDGMLAIAAEKEAQHHPEQPLEMVAPSDVPLPEPVASVGDVYTLYWYGSGPIAPLVDRNGIKPGCLLVTQKQAEAYAKAAVAAERERCIKVADDQWVANPNISGGEAIRDAQKGAV